MGRRVGRAHVCERLYLCVLRVVWGGGGWGGASVIFAVEEKRVNKIYLYMTAAFAKWGQRIIKKGKGEAVCGVSIAVPSGLAANSRFSVDFKIIRRFVFVNSD